MPVAIGDRNDQSRTHRKIDMQLTLEQFHQEYETETQSLKIGDRQLSILKPKSIDRFIDADNTLHNFPLWAKIWESSLILCNHLAEMPVTSGQRMLEIGAGLGTAGLVAAAIGHDITISEYNPDALHFIRANAQTNGFDELPIHPLDWTQPTMDRRFDLIIGSDVTYNADSIPLLSALFDALLAPGGTIVLAEQVRSTGTTFMDAMSPRYDIEARKHQLRSTGKSLTVILFKMQAL